jgi:SNF2 family DNA or RNA helicase
LIAPFLLRRTKNEVAKELPELSEQIVHCDMNEVQENYYEREKSKARNLVMENINSMGLQKASLQILQSLMKLRQIANHPGLVDEDYISGSGKFDEIKRNLENLYNEGHKALVFSSFVGHLDLVSDWLTAEGIGFVTLTGETRKREEVVARFQNDEKVSFFLISLKAGGVGLNLTAADYVLMLDPWWNPAAEKQAINRAHRIGQDKNVMVYRFISTNTLEEKILKLQERKSELADIFVNENTFSKITQEEIMELFE